MGDSAVCALDTEDGDTRLHVAAAEGDVTKLREYYITDPEMFRSNINRCIRPLNVTPLRLAVCRVYVSAVQFLLEHEADVDIPDRKGQTALFHAVLQGSPECVQLLLEAGASPDGSPLNMLTPIHACMFQSIYCKRQSEIFRALLKYGATLELGAQYVLQCTLCLIFSTDNPVFYLTLYYLYGGCLRKCVCNRNSFEKHIKENDVAEQLKQIMSSPLALKSLCCIVVRRCLTKKRLKYMEQLPVPKSLVSFLQNPDAGI